MEMNTFYWIAGSAIVLYLGYKVLKSSSDDKGKKGRKPENGKLPVGISPKPEPTDVPTDIVEKQTKPAKDAFIENINLFKPLLRNLHLNSMDSQIWQEAIISTNNQELLDYWKKVKGNASSWLTILQMWGIKLDACQSFICIESYKELYETNDGTLLENGKKYSVESPCWILTKTDKYGKTSKEIILKGKVKCN